MDKKNKVVDILGTKYSIVITHKESDRLLCSCSGYCDKTSKRIVVQDIDSTWELDNPKEQLKKILRHEIIHAYLFESGIGENLEHRQYGQEETMIDWLAYQGLKIYNTWREVGAI